MSANGWIGVDLDGTLAHYDHWRGPDHIGKPIEPMMERVFVWLEEGREVKIFTARVSEADPEQRAARIKTIQDWCWRYGLPRLEVTNVKDFRMVELWDDRAIQVIANTGILATEI